MATLFTGWLLIWYVSKLWTLNRPLVFMDYARLAAIGWVS
jgi:hypothetical protein